MLKPTNENERLKALYSYGMMDTEAEKHYDSITNLATYICKTPMAAMNLIDDRRLWVKSKVGINTCEISKDISFCKYTIQTDEILEIKDTLLDERFKNHLMVANSPFIRYYAGVPLINPEGYILGALCVFDTQPGQLDEKQQQALKFLAEEAILHLETSKKNAELQLLLKEQQKFQALFNNSAELHCVSGKTGKIEFINQAVGQLLGYTIKDTFGQSLLDFYAHDEQERVKQAMLQVTERGEGQLELLSKMTTKSGETRWFSWYNVYLHEQWLSNGRDITRHILAEQELQQLSLVASHVNNGVVINDANNKILWVNKAFEKITGYSNQEVKGSGLRDIIAGKHTDRKILDYATTKSTDKKSFSIELLVYHKNAKPIWLSIMNSIILDEKGEMSKSIEIITDITEQKKAETEMQTLSFALQKSEAGVLIRNGKEEVVWMNEALEEMLGWKLSELKGSVVGNKFNGEKTDLAVFRNAKKAVNYKKPCDIEIALYRKNGTLLWVSVFNNPLFDDEGNVNRQLSIMTDITARKKAEQELIRTREEALQLSHAKETFISVISHEIRTPINAVIGMSRILLEENPAPSQLEHLNILKFSSENLLKLVNDILDFTKIETGNMLLESVPVNLKQLARQTLHTLEFKLENKNLKLVLAISPNLPELVLADSTRLYQILMNLLGNAIKFTAQGEVKLSLEVENEGLQDVIVKFSVSDTGIGIPADRLKVIFEAYSQAGSDTTRKYGGTGLGLTITKKLIELHQSVIKVKSEPGKGSEFSFQISFKRTTAEPQKPVSPIKLEPLNAYILVADDNVINLTLAKKILLKWGLQVDFAENGLEAYEMAMQKDYDLILMDLHMPIMDGLEATRKIRQQPDEKYQTIPIIALTGSVFGLDLENLHREGLTGHFLKPYAPEGLYNKIKPYLKQAALS